MTGIIVWCYLSEETPDAYLVNGIFRVLLRDILETSSFVRIHPSVFKLETISPRILFSEVFLIYLTIGKNLSWKKMDTWRWLWFSGFNFTERLLKKTIVPTMQMMMKLPCSLVWQLFLGRCVACPGPWYTLDSFHEAFSEFSSVYLTLSANCFSTTNKETSLLPTYPHVMGSFFI